MDTYSVILKTVETEAVVTGWKVAWRNTTVRFEICIQYEFHTHLTIQRQAYVKIDVDGVSYVRMFCTPLVYSQRLNLCGFVHLVNIELCSSLCGNVLSTISYLCFKYETLCLWTVLAKSLIW